MPSRPQQWRYGPTFKWVVILFVIMVVPLVGMKMMENHTISTIAFNVLVYFPILPAFVRWRALVWGK